MSFKPRVGTAYPADRYARPAERIMEVSHANGGCLISIEPQSDGRLKIEIYLADDTVYVVGPARNPLDTPDPGEHSREARMHPNQCGEC